MPFGSLLVRFCAAPALLGVVILGRVAWLRLNIEFDYQFDTMGMFDDPARCEVLEQAGRAINRWTDDLAAIDQSGSNTWVGAVVRPDTSQIELIQGSELSIQADTMIVYVGARPLAGSHGRPGRGDRQRGQRRPGVEGPGEVSWPIGGSVR